MKIEVKVYTNDGKLISQITANAATETAQSYEYPVIDSANKSIGLAGWKWTPFWIDLPPL